MRASCQSGKNLLKIYSPTVNAGTFTIPGGGGGGGNPNASLIDNYALVLGNWTISTSNANQADPQSLPPNIVQFGSSSQITQWVLANLEHSWQICTNRGNQMQVLC
jgi:hypothetical protein